MPLAVQDILDLPYYASPARFALEPARSAVESLLLLTSSHELPGVADWVNNTIQSLSKTERRTNELVILGLHYVVLPMESWSSFPAYLEYLAGLPAEKLRDKMLNVYHKMPPTFAGSEPVMDPMAALASADNYLAFLRQRFQPENIDEEIERQVYSYVIDPPALQRLVIDHLTEMWKKYLAAEWERVRPMLQEAVHAFQQLDLKGKSLAEIVRLVVDQNLDDDRCAHMFRQTSRIVFVPHPHVGPYMLKSFKGDSELIIFFGARLPKGVMIDAPDLSRTDIVVRLGALADDTRLRILRFIAERGEQRSQEIMEALELSQSAASRQLTQLSAAGYLVERRCEGAKCYALNPERITDTLQAIRNFLLVGERSQI